MFGKNVKGSVVAAPCPVCVNSKTKPREQRAAHLLSFPLARFLPVFSVDIPHLIADENCCYCLACTDEHLVSVTLTWQDAFF
jgi:hypothetical protein